jgi:hypothetical protein
MARSMFRVASVAVLVGAAVVLPGTTASAVPTRYEAEVAPATCSGTIDSN